MAESSDTNRISSVKVIDELTALKRLPSFPNLLIEFDRLVNQPEGAHIEEIAELLIADPRISIGVVKTASTAKYSAKSNPNLTLENAIAMMGVDDIRLLVVALSFQEIFQKQTQFNQKCFLQHSIVAAFIAKYLSPYFNVGAYEAFLMGLFHDIGVYVLSTYSEEGVHTIGELSMHKVTRLVASENKVLGVSHPKVGARLLQNWGLSKSVVMGVLGHHAPALIDNAFKEEAHLTLLAEAGAFYLQLENGLVSGDIEMTADTTLATLKRIDMTPEAFIQLVNRAFEDAKKTQLI